MKIQRYQGNVLSPATNAQGQERTLFGSQSQGDDLDSNLNASLLRGWGIVGPNEHPTLQDFNGAMYTLGQFIAYLHQMGIPEWHTDQEFHTGSLTLRGGAIYVSQIDDNTGNDPDTDDGTNWMGLTALSIAYDNADSALTEENVKAALDELDSLRTALDTSYDNTYSTLTDTNVKDALDSLDAKFEGLTEPGTVIDTQTFTDPTGNPHTWTKPASAEPNDTVVARIWAGGGSGAASEEGPGTSATGGNGGAFIEISFRASELGSTETVEVGAGGDAVNITGGGSSGGNDGGNSSFADFVAYGGLRGNTDASSSTAPLGKTGFSFPGSSFQIKQELYASSQGGEVDAGTPNGGDDALYGGAAGGSSATLSGSSPDSLGGTSYYGGDGGNGDGGGSINVLGGDGTAPGGGGGGATTGANNDATSGAGADGRVEVYVIRGWSPSGITADIT